VVIGGAVRFFKTLEDWRMPAAWKSAKSVDRAFSPV